MYGDKYIYFKINKHRIKKHTHNKQKTNIKRPVHYKKSFIRINDIET